MPCDYKNYPDNWKTEIRPNVLKKAKNCCEFCGVPNYALIFREGERWLKAPEGHEIDMLAEAGVKFVKIILTIAHLDHNTQNNDLSNLKALCQKCHNNYDKDYRAKNRKENKLKKQKQSNLFNE